MRATVVLVLCALSACFAPSAPVGLACGDGDRCPEGQVCVAGQCRRSAPDAGGPGDAAVSRPDADLVPDFDAMPSAYNRAFFTALTYTGALGGLAGADALCQLEADAAGFGTEVFAFLATEGVTAASRFAGSRGWVDVSGAFVADLATEFEDSTQRRPVARTASGAAVGQRLWMLGGNGTTCIDWTAQSTTTFARFVDTSALPRSAATGGCQTSASLLCLERRVNLPLPADNTPGRLAWVSRTTWTPGGGRASADLVCQAEAEDQGLAGTYLAVLTDGATSAFDRMAPSPDPWVRVDGVALAATATALAAGDPVFLQAYPNRALDGEVHNAATWFGNTLTDNDCGSWNNPAAAGAIANVSATRWPELFASGSTATCNLALSLLCLEQ